jgi:hypothetical protein
MSIIIRMFLIIILVYGIFVKSFTSFFDFLNQKPTENYWTTFLEIDLPNIIAIFSMIALLIILIRQIGSKILRP